eukprot:g29955.t1
MAVASELRLPIYVMSFSSERMNDEVLSSLLQYGMHDPPTILLLEERQRRAAGRKLTTADIQRHLMKRKKSPERAVQEVQELIDAFADEPTAPRPEKEPGGLER